jgi:hypothetical protein
MLTRPASPVVVVPGVGLFVDMVLGGPHGGAGAVIGGSVGVGGQAPSASGMPSNTLRIKIGDRVSESLHNITEAFPRWECHDIIVYDATIHNIKFFDMYMYTGLILLLLCHPSSKHFRTLSALT